MLALNSPVIDNQISANPIGNSLTGARKGSHFSLSTYLIFTIFPSTFLLVGVGAFMLHTFFINRVAKVTENSPVGIATYEAVFFVSALVLATLISGVIYWLISIQVVQPLKRLSNSLELEPSTEGENEIEKLSRHIQHMRVVLDKKDKELAAEHRKIDHLFSIQYDTDNPPSLENFFHQVLGIIQDITGFSAITLRLYEPHTQLFRIMAQTGMTPEMFKDLQFIPAQTGIHAEIIQTHKPVFISDISHDGRLSSSAPISAGYHSLACIPLLAQDVLVGSMQLVTKKEYLWSENDRRWLGLIGRRTGLIIHLIQLSEGLRDLAVLEERLHIAQEIHDGLSQLVGALCIWSDEALVCLKDHELEDTQKALEKIQDVARDAYTSLREEMLGLRDSIFPSKELSAFLSGYLDRFQRQWGIQTELQVDQCAEDLDTLPISPAAEIQLLRIFQESLTNVRRHANASRIIIALSCADGWLVVRILDDGAGFDPDNIPDDRLGLRIMRERAASVGGAIAISSQIGQGTQLDIKIPLRL
jgi:nitrate/nitrite-specific signal transduction histidine kinase